MFVIIIIIIIITTTTNSPSVLVRNRFGFLCVNGVQHWSEDSPRFSKLINSHKVDLTAAKYVEDQALVRVRHFHALHATPIYTHINILYLHNAHISVQTISP